LGFGVYGLSRGVTTTVSGIRGKGRGVDQTLQKGLGDGVVENRGDEVRGHGDVLHEGAQAALGCLSVAQLDAHAQALLLQALDLPADLTQVVLEPAQQALHGAQDPVHAPGGVEAADGGLRV